MNWVKQNRITRQHTGKFYQDKDGCIGEAVHFWGWGGVDLLFENHTTAVFAIGDVVAVEPPQNAADFAAITFDEYGAPH